MKFPVMTKELKSIIVGAIVIIWILLFAMLFTHYITLNNTITPFVIVVEALVVVGWLVVTIVLVKLCFAFVTINKNGITQCTGKRVIKNAQWNEIDEIELTETTLKWGKRLCINVILKEENCATQTGKMTLRLFDKHAISIPYTKKAYEAIKQYYVNDIDNAYLSFHYDDDGKPL